jgi:thymidine kinase
MKNSNRNGIELILGTMRCGKTAELLRRVAVQRNFAHHDVLVVKPADDTKSGTGVITSRYDKGEQQMPAIEIDSQNPWEIYDILEKEERKLNKRMNAIAIDEGQFVKDLFPLAGSLLENGYDLLIAGLDLDFRGLPFGDMLKLQWFVSAYGGSVTQCVSYCECGAQAFFSQRLDENGDPAPYDSPIIMPGESYRPRCRKCFVLPGRPHLW